MSNDPNGASAPPVTSQALTPYQARAIELRESISHEAPRAIVPRTFAEAQAFASAIAHSSLVPDALRERAPDILMIVLAGAELGIPPVKAIGLYHVIEGVPKLSADGVAGVCAASPLCEYLRPIEQSDQRVTWAAKKVGEPEVRLSWTDEDVKRAGLDRPTRNGGPSNHMKFPRAMKNARCKAELCRMVWPEICAGLLTAEEAREIVDAREATPPATGAGFSALPPPPASTPATSSSTPASSTKATGSKAPKSDRPPPSGAAVQRNPIDTTATERPANTSGASSTNASPSSASTSSSSGSPPPSNGGGGNGPLPPDPARDEAFRKARENADEIERARRENASPFPHPADGAPPANMNDEIPPATSSTPTDAVAPDAASGASDDFGADETPAPARTLEAFTKALDAAVASKDPKNVDAVKADWLPWSKIEGPGGGKAHAHAMRDAFAKAKATLGIK